MWGGGELNKVRITSSMTWLFNPRPAGYVAHEAILCGPRNQMLSYIFAELNEKMNKKIVYYDILFLFIHCGCFIKWNLIVRIFQVFLNSSDNVPILLHGASLMTWLIGVRPAVDLSWKALKYEDPVWMLCSLNKTKSGFHFLSERPFY